MNQISNIPFADASTVSVELRANPRLGNYNLVVENTGANTLSMQCRTLSGTTWTPIESFFTVVAKGVTTRSYSLVDKVVGIFGSGNTTASVSTVLRNKADLRGAGIDLVVLGKRGWGVDTSYPSTAYTPAWGSTPTS